MSWTPPPLPEENEDPWYEKRQAWDISVQNRLSDSFASQGELPDGTDLNTLNTTKHNGVYMLSSYNTYPNAPFDWFGTGATLIISHSGNGAGILQEFIVETTRMYRESYSASAMGPWTRLLNQSDTPSGRIKALAKRDGWKALYDPTDPDMVKVDVNGAILEIGDSLGNLPPLKPDTVNRSYLRPSAFGQLSGITGKATMAAELESVIPQPLTVMALASEEKTYSLQRAIFGGTGSSNRFQMGFTASNKPYMGNAYIIKAGRGTRPRPGCHIWEGRLSEGNSILNIDGQLQTRGLTLGEKQREGINAIRVGSGNRNASGGMVYPWQGNIGPILIREGVDVAASNRMRKLFETLVGTKSPSPSFSQYVRAIDLDAYGDPTVVWGNPDIVTVGGAASITKVLNAVIARAFLTTNAELDTVVEVLAEDEFMQNTPNLVAGDKLSYRDLLYSMLLPSNNTAPRTIARLLGAEIEGEGTGRSKYIQKMRDLLDDWGFHGAYIDDNPGGGLRASTYQLAQLMRYAMEDTLLKQIMSTQSKDVVITGNNPRTVTVETTLAKNVYGVYPEFVAFKAGTSPNTAGAVMAYNHYDGTVHTMAIQGSILNIDSLYDQIDVLMEAAQSEEPIDHRFIPVAAFKYQTGPNPESWGL